MQYRKKTPKIFSPRGSAFTVNTTVLLQGGCLTPGSSVLPLLLTVRSSPSGLSHGQSASGLKISVHLLIFYKKCKQKLGWFPL